MSNRNHGILFRVLERRSRREGALLIAGSEHEEEVAEIKGRREGRRSSSSSSRAARRALESRIATQEIGSRRSCCSLGSQRLPSPARTFVCPLPVFMASPDDPLRSGKVAPCRARTWSVTTSWVREIEPQSPLRALQDTRACARCVPGWMRTVVAHCPTSPILTPVLPLCEQQLTCSPPAHGGKVCVVPLPTRRPRRALLFWATRVPG